MKKLLGAKQTITVGLKDHHSIARTPSQTSSEPGLRTPVLGLRCKGLTVV